MITIIITMIIIVIIIVYSNTYKASLTAQGAQLHLTAKP